MNHARGFAFGLGGLALAVGLLVGWGISGGMNRAMGFPPSATGGGSVVALSAAGQRVASGLNCPCGCPDLLLACDCGNQRGAGEVKQLINDLLNSGKTEAEARIELINRYGAAIQRAGR